MLVNLSYHVSTHHDTGVQVSGDDQFAIPCHVATLDTGRVFFKVEQHTAFLHIPHLLYNRKTCKHKSHTSFCTAFTDSYNIITCVHVQLQAKISKQKKWQEQIATLPANLSSDDIKQILCISKTSTKCSKMTSSYSEDVHIPCQRSESIAHLPLIMFLEQAHIVGFKVPPPHTSHTISY